MDIRKREYYGQMAFTGSADSQSFKGPIITIVGEALKSLQQATPRKDSQGNKEIIIRISATPFAESLNREEATKAIDVGNMIATTDESNPSTGETAEQYYQRLVQSGYSPSGAAAISALWFPES